MTQSQNVYFYVDHGNKRNVVFFRKGTAVDLGHLGQVIEEGGRNVFKATTFVELGEDVTWASNNIIKGPCKKDNLLRFYQEGTEHVSFLRFESSRHAFWIWRFTKQSFASSVISIGFPTGFQLMMRPLECAEVEREGLQLGDKFIVRT